ncbi:MAG: hypothetical protein KGI49_01370 [Patescibacteria group bacterium]|nr:hypothetical protein [Patescibacteria group bacterium]
MDNRSRNLFHTIARLAIVSASVLAIFAMFLSARPKPAHAQLGCAVSGLFSSLTSSVGGLLGIGGGSSSEVPTNDQKVRDNSSALKNVQCVLNGIAWQLGQQALHSLTASVVNWINSGFQGSPAFLTDPKGFFLDVADQTTGWFLANSGPLQGLCSPWSVDIRLNLALQQAQDTNQRYTCTLGTIINNAQNASLNNINVSVGTSPNGATLGDIMSGNILNNPNQLSMNGNSVNTIQGFLNGDFSQGGWQAFLALTTNPQNNPYGSYLMAKSDLASQIGQRQSAYSQDLTQGHGFLSWQSCKQVPLADNNTFTDSLTGETVSGSTGSTQTVCTTETPGSVIESSLETSLGSPVRNLELTKDINEIVDALFSQLLTQTLNGGLFSTSHTSSSGSGNVTQSLVQQLQNSQDDQAMSTNQQYLQGQLASEAQTSVTNAQTAQTYYSQAVTSLGTALVSYNTTQSCIADELANATGTSVTTLSASYLQSQLTAIGSDVSNISGQLSVAETNAANASTSVTTYQGMVSNIQNASSLSEANSLSQQYSTVDPSIQAAGDPGAAETYLATVLTFITAENNKLKSYQQVCAGTMPTSQ